MSEWCVCSASHGHPPGSRSRLARSSSRTISARRARRTRRRPRRRAMVRWSGTTRRGRARRAAPARRARRAGPRRWSTVTGVSGSRCSSSVSFTSESTSAWSHCAMSIGPASSTVSIARPSTTRASRRHRIDARARAHARSANDKPGTTSTTSTPALVQQRDRAFGDRRAARHRVHDVLRAPPPRRRACRPCARTPTRDRARRRRRRRTT